jgi:hypothetical protein
MKSLLFGWINTSQVDNDIETPELSLDQRSSAL